MDDCWPPIMKILLALSRPVFPAGKVAFPRLIHPNPGRGTPITLAAPIMVNRRYH